MQQSTAQWQSPVRTALDCQRDVTPEPEGRSGWWQTSTLRCWSGSQEASARFRRCDHIRKTTGLTEFQSYIRQQARMSLCLSGPSDESLHSPRCHSSLLRIAHPLHIVFCPHLRYGLLNRRRYGSASRLPGAGSRHDIPPHRHDRPGQGHSRFGISNWEETPIVRDHTGLKFIAANC